VANFALILPILVDEKADGLSVTLECDSVDLANRPAEEASALQLFFQISVLSSRQ
jgi:hypothetical protein